jgi:uncharacterized membrane protein YphA (DoxX/SURF4 family)
MCAGYGGRVENRRTFVLDLIGLLVRLGLATVFLISGVSKAVNPRETRVAVRAYDLLPTGVADTVAAVLPYLEIGLGLLLVLGMVVRWTAVVSAVLLLVFIGGVISAAARGLNIDCGCFGGGGTVAAGQTRYAAEIARDVGFLAMAVWLIVRPRTLWSVDSLAHRESVESEEEIGART